MNKFRIIIKSILLLAIILFIAFLIGFNVSTKVPFNYVFGSIESASLVLIILSSFFLGIIFTLLFWGFISFSTYLQYKKKLKNEIKLKKATFIAEKKSNE